MPAFMPQRWVALPSDTVKKNSAVSWAPTCVQGSGDDLPGEMQLPTCISFGKKSFLKFFCF